MITAVQNQSNQHAGEIKNILDDHFAQLAKNPLIKSAALGVETLDGDFSWVGVHGPVNLKSEPMAPDTPVWIASVTKLYIASAIFKLYEAGQIDIEKPISAYLPADLIHGIHHTADGIDHTHKITVRNLLSHSSGLPDFLEESPEGEESMLDQILDGNDMEFSIDEAMNLIREHIPAYFPPQPDDRKKKKIQYSDTNFQLLIEIIKTITGQSLSDAFSELIYRPVGLEHTFHPGTRSGNGTKEAAMIWSGDQALDIPKAMASFGDLNSTVDDMNKFMRSLIKGKFFDTSQTWQLMQDDFNAFGFSFDPTPTAPSWPIEYGLGLMRFRMPKLFTLLNPVPAVIGHTGVSGSWLFYCPERDLIFSGTVNQVAAAATPFRFAPRLMGDRRWKSLLN